MAPLDRWRELRDRWLASARFRRVAAAFPLTRPIARRRAAELFDLCAGFVYSQVLYACVQLRLFEALARGPKSLAELAAAADLPPDAMARLLNAAAALDLVEPRGDERYGLGALGSVLAGDPGLTAMIEHHRLLYADLADPVALLRAPRGIATLNRYWTYAARPADPPPVAWPDAAHAAPYSQLMAATVPMIAAELLAAYPLARHRRLLDVGGGTGALAAEVARRVPRLEVQVFDLPAVAAQAAQRFAQDGLAPRVSADGGDFFRDPLPPGADVISLVRIVHDHDDASVATLLRAVRAALPDDGVLLIAEPFAGKPSTARVTDAYFGLYLLAMGQGRTRNIPEMKALLAAAGFGRVTVAHTRIPLQTGLLIARV